ncbi:MAG: hypothetical protein NXI09_00515 [Bacteroidetes bacterium]|nr:hypothetical protein [Bacteroidota bacterium]
MKRLFALIVLISLPMVEIFAQNSCIELHGPDIPRDKIPPMDRYDLDFYYHGMNHDLKAGDSLKHDLYYTLQRNWVANQEIAYMTFAPLVQSIGAYRIPLRANEGEAGPLSLFEAKVPVRFVVAQGRPSSNAIYRSMRITLDYMPNFRMHLDESKPLSPSDQRVGLTWDYAFWNNNRNLEDKADSSQTYATNLVPINRKYLQSLNFSFRVHHYSNGQSPGFFFTDSTGDQRNDYQSGDFSSNYFRFGLTHSLNVLNSGKLIQSSLYLRQDWGTNSGLFFSPEQNRAYGRTRIEMVFDYRGRVFYAGKRVSYLQDGKRYLLRKAFQNHWRLELTYIADDLSDFRPNLKNWETGDSKYRTGLKAFYELSPLNHRNIGYMAMIYYGRDYLNIRYDNIVYSIQVGVSFSLDKYFPTLYNTNRTVEGLAGEDYAGPWGLGNLPAHYQRVD